MDNTTTKTPPMTPEQFLEKLFATSAEWTKDERFSSIGDADSFFSKVMGGTFEGRQNVISQMVEGDRLDLVRDPENPYDRNAVKVCRGDLQLGFLRKEIAKRIAPNIDGGDIYTCYVGSVTGGGVGRSYGVNIHVSRARKNEKRPVLDLSSYRISETVAAVKEALLGKNQLRQKQVDVIGRIESGTNVLAVFGTGRGKSACFQIPAVERALTQQKKTIIFYPLRALANDQYEAMTNRLEHLPVRILRANGSIEPEERQALYAALETGEWDIMIATPEFATRHAEVFGAQRNRPDLVVVDEAHHLHDSRHRQAYVEFENLLRKLGNPPTAAFTATADTEAFSTIRRVLGIDSWVIDDTVRENLQVVDRRELSNKHDYIMNVVHKNAGKTIVYAMSRNECVKIAEKMRASFPAVAFYHAGVPRAERLMIEKMFREGDIKVVVATSAFGEGIDLPDVRNVVLYHLHFDFTELNQQAGRAGRDGEEAHIHLLYGQGDRRINDYILEKSAPSESVLRDIYKTIRSMAMNDIVRSTYEAIADIADGGRRLPLDGSTVSAAVRIFQEVGIMDVGSDEDGRFIRVPAVSGKINIRASARYAEGLAEKEAFGRFYNVAVLETTENLQNRINRPIYPKSIPLSC